MGEPLLRLVTSLRATRHFTSAPVRDDEVRRVLEAGRWTGSARNRQPWRFVVVRDPSVRGRLGRLGGHAHHLPGAPVVVAIATDGEHGGRDTAFDAGRACQNLALAAHALGLGSCPATLYPDGNAEAAARLVGLGAPWRVEHALALGRPAPRPPGVPAVPTGRRPLDELSWEV